MGMPVVEVQVLCTVIHGLNDGFIAVVDWMFPFVLFVVVVLFVTAVAVDLLSLSLLLVFGHSCWLDDIVFWLALGGLAVVLSLLSLFACGACGIFLLFGSHVRVGASVGLKNLVIHEFLLVLVPICFLVCVG